jgi:CBS domain-containing protein
MKAIDVMSDTVITVTPDLEVTTIARLLVESGISAVPVVTPEGKLLGIVSEGDLIRRIESDTERGSSWWLEMFGSSQQRVQDFLKAHGRTAADVMTRDVVTAGPDTSLREIANLLEKHRIKRVPIVEDGQLLGIVSRANLVQVLASCLPEMVWPETDDNKLRAAVLRSVHKQPGNAALVNAFAETGVVSLWGMVPSEEERTAIRIAAEETPGVIAVRDNMSVGRPAPSL